MNNTDAKTLRFYTCRECGGRVVSDECSCGEWLTCCLDCGEWDFLSSYEPESASVTVAAPATEEVK